MFCPGLIIRLLAQDFPPAADRTPTREELKMLGHLRRLLTERDLEVVEKEEDLGLDEDEIDDPDWDGDDEPEELATLPDGAIARFSGGTPVKEKQVFDAIRFMRSSVSGSRPLSTMSKNYRFVKTENDMTFLRKIEQDGVIRMGRYDALRLLKSLLEYEVKAKIEDKISIHDLDIARMALAINAEKELLPGFKASSDWVQRFKKSVGIVSRRITVFISKKSLRDQDKTDKLSAEFVTGVRDTLHSLSPPALVFNCDQSGFTKELHSARALSTKGEKKTERMAQSVSAMTHPFTIMPVLTMDGRLGKKLFVQMKEVGGHFPRTITPYQAENLHIVPGTSHMMTKATMLEFFTECVIPEVNSSALVIVDSWSSFKDHAAIQRLVPPGLSLEVRNIPAGATSKIQPCDVFFFRFMKTIYRRFHDHIIIYDIKYDLNRDNLLKLISAIYRIFSNARFDDFLRYSWHRAGYEDTRGGRFLTPVEYCFPSAISSCQEPGCTEKIAFVRCPECEESFCFRHFLEPTPHKIHWC